MRKRFTHLAKIIGYSILIMLALFTILVLYPLSYFKYPDQDYSTFVIRNVSVIDVEKDTLYANKVVVIQDGIIKHIEDSSYKLPQNSKQKIKSIDGTGKYLLPALWDMHVHLTKQSPHIAYPAFISHGIMHVRDMRGAYDSRDPFAGVQSRLEEWNRKVEKHEMIGPKLHGFTSFAVEGPHKMFDGKPSFFDCATPADAIKLVQYLKKQNVTLIKMYNHIPRDAFFALMQEASKKGIDVAGHKPYRVSTLEASNVGMKSVEHARFFIWDSFSGADSLRRNNIFYESTELRKTILANQDTGLLKEMFAAFRKNNTYYCPTHLTRKQDAFAGDSSFRARYDGINPILRFLAFEDLDATRQEDTTGEATAVYHSIYAKGLEISGAASRNGVKIIAGSDVPELPGSSLHEELKELSKAGLSNYEVLRTATLYPARYYGLDNEYGSIKEGKKADLLLLSKNPLDAIENTTTISNLIFNGKHLDEAFISQLKKKSKERGVGIVLTAKLTWDMLIYMILI